MTKEELSRIRITKPDSEIKNCIKERWNHIAKPLDSLGRFETMIAQIGAIIQSEEVDINKKAVLVMCADNGIVEEGISQSGQEVTSIVADSMIKGQSSVCKMAKTVGADVKVIDVGINREMPKDGIIDKKIANGTKNFLYEPAMSEAEMLQAVSIGMEMVELCKGEQYQIVAMGEMGIGNTTTSSAVAAALLGCSVDEITGRGAGLSDAGLMKKREVIERALKKYELKGADPLRILATVGGFDIAALAGVCIGGARYRMPIVMDGMISAIAALVAERLAPGIKEFLIPSHISKEPAAKIIMQELNLLPVIDADMALGEGSGAVMMLSLLDIALSIYEKQTQFQDIGIKKYERFKEEKLE